jgi:hypothetical protein
MSTLKYLGIVVLSTFILMTVFGLYLPHHMGHEMGCPFAPGETAMCAAPFAHIQHWQSSFTSILVELLALVAIVFVLFTRPDPQRDKDPQYQRFRLRQRIPMRPPLFQELYSQGILNRKEPPLFAYASTIH